MKNIIALVIVSMFIFWACTDNNSILDSVSQDQFADNQSAASEPNWVQLPARPNGSLGKIISKTKLIRANRFDAILEFEMYSGGPLGRVKVIAAIMFRAGTINEDTYITMEIDDETGIATFSPSMVFNQDATLYLKLQGLDLSDMDEDVVDFKYLASSGSYESVDFSRLKFDRDKGLLEVVGAKIPHFSRYGFTR